MSIKNIFKYGLSFVAAGLFMTGCGDDSSSADESSDSSSSILSFSSSSSLSTRADIIYKDSIALGDTIKLNIELFDGDSSKMDETELYVEDSVATFPLYLGELPKGSRIKVYASTGETLNDTIRIKGEKGNYLKTLSAAPKDKDRIDSVFEDYFIPSFGSKSDAIFKDSMQYVAFKDDFYFIEVSGKFTSASTMTLKVLVDSAYFNYTGETDSLSLKGSDTLHGIMTIGDTIEELNIHFASSEGFSINLSTKVTNIIQCELTSDTTLLGSYTKAIDTMLVPKDSVQWKLKVVPETFSNYKTGNFAFVDVFTKSRELEKGEYFSNPDSISMPGEVLKRSRPKDYPDSAIYKYNLRQEQFVWMGDYKKGDSLVISHWIENYNDEDFASPVTYEILDKDQKKRGTISSTYGGEFKVTDDMPEGPYYLHYMRLNSYPLAQVSDSLRYVLQLYTLVKQPGLVDSMKYYNAELDAYGKTKELSPKDTIRLDNYTFFMTTKSDKSWKVTGENVSWYVPCKSLNYINNNYKVSDCEASKTAEQFISSDILLVQDSVHVTAQLIAVSEADPTKRDTLEFKILPAGN